MALRPVFCRAAVQQFIGQQHPLPVWYGRVRMAPFRDRLVVATSRREGLMMALVLGQLPRVALHGFPAHGCIL